MASSACTPSSSALPTPSSHPEPAQPETNEARVEEPEQPETNEAHVEEPEQPETHASGADEHEQPEPAQPVFSIPTPMNPYGFDLSDRSLKQLGWWIKHHRGF